MTTTYEHEDTVDCDWCGEYMEMDDITTVEAKCSFTWSGFTEVFLCGECESDEVVDLIEEEGYNAVLKHHAAQGWLPGPDVRTLSEILADLGTSLVPLGTSLVSEVK